MRGQGAAGQLDPNDKQGGKKFGELKDRQKGALEEINKEFLDDDTYKDVEDLEEKLEAYQAKFMDIDVSNTGDLTEMDLKLMLEKLGQPKTHNEVKKMIQQVDQTNKGTICYRDFLEMMLGSRSAVLKLILMFEEKGKERPKPAGHPRRRHIESLIAQ